MGRKGSGNTQNILRSGQRARVKSFSEARIRNRKRVDVPFSQRTAPICGTEEGRGVGSGYGEGKKNVRLSFSALVSRGVGCEEGEAAPL